MLFLHSAGKASEELLKITVRNTLLYGSQQTKAPQLLEQSTFPQNRFLLEADFKRKTLSSSPDRFPAASLSICSSLKAVCFFFPSIYIKIKSFF